MLIAVWIVTALLALANLGAGGMKLFSPVPALRQRLPWAEEVGTVPTRLIGLAEVLGAIGVVLPALLNIAPILTPIAAVGLASSKLRRSSCTSAAARARTSRPTSRCSRSPCSSRSPASQASRSQERQYRHGVAGNWQQSSRVALIEEGPNDGQDPRNLGPFSS